jgi:uncharacterized heparinase superfamily protein
VQSAEGGQLEPIPPAPGLCPTLGTYWRTLRHLRWSQLGYLVLRRVLPRSPSPVSINAPVGLRRVPAPWPFREWHAQASRQMLATRQFTFLNRTVDASGSIPWNDAHHAKLWLYHLNYFDYLNVVLALPEEEPLLRAGLAIALDWRRQNPRGDEVGWEPYALSLRIVNWLKFTAAHTDALQAIDGGDGFKTLLASAGEQAATLEPRLEKDLRANHLLKNIKALLFAGALLESPRSARWWRTGDELLAAQLREQILGDGGHFERSPMYHAQVLEDLVDVRLMCRATNTELACAGLLEEKIAAMTRFLRGVLNPDGEIPFFNDSTLGGARPPAELLSIAEFPDLASTASEPAVTVFAETGYAVMRSPESRSALVFDCGPLGPDYQPGHGHCDVLSYELSLHGQRVVVNTGVSTYDTGPERFYERSTAAHNTLRIDGEEQAEIWGSFRVGRRPRVGPIRSGAVSGFPYVSGEHEGYRRLGVVHARTILLQGADTWIVIDRLKGCGEHMIESFLHLHPSVGLEERNDESNRSVSLPLLRWNLKFIDQRYALTTFGPGQFELRAGWYSERFGNRQPCTVLRWTWRGSIPAGMIHVFAPASAAPPPIAANWAGSSIEVAGVTIPLR